MAAIPVILRSLGFGLMLTGMLVLSSIAMAYEGFGAVTRGAEDCPAGFVTYHVTSLANSGTGTFRDGVSQGCRRIVFDVGGTITLTADLFIVTSYLTIDGSTAPSPGITFQINDVAVGLGIRTSQGLVTHDIIVHHLRVIGPGGGGGQEDLFGIDDNGVEIYNIILDHLTLRSSTDGTIDIPGSNTHDVTVSWNLMVDTELASLIRTGVYNLSYHHNVFARNNERQPKIRDNTEVDFVNNVIYGWGWMQSAGRGIQMDSVGATDPKVNIAKNHFHRVTTTADPNPDGAIEYQNGIGDTRTYFEGNAFSGDGINETDTATDASPVVTVPAYAQVTQYDAATLGNTVVPCVGTVYRTADEQSLLNTISVAIGGSGGTCGSPPAAPTNLRIQ